MQLNCGTSQTLVLITEEMLVMEHKERESVVACKTHVMGFIHVCCLFTSQRVCTPFPLQTFGISTSNKQMYKKATWIPEI